MPDNIKGQLSINLDGSITEDSPEPVRESKELQQAEAELIQMMHSEKKKWVDIYSVMQRVQDTEMYKPVFSTFHGWIAELAKREGFLVRDLYRYQKAGRFYTEYRKRMEAAGHSIAPLQGLKTTVSPRSIELVEKISAGDTKKADRYMKQVCEGKLTTPQLQQVWKSAKADGVVQRKTRFDAPKTVQAQEDGKFHVTAADLVATLQTDYSWVPDVKTEKLPTVKNAYRVLTEFAVHTGSADRARRIDAAVLETISTRDIDEVHIHAIENKVSVSDLQHDDKMAEYTMFSDYFWICVPDTEEMISAAEDYIADVPDERSSWGILAVSEGTVRTARKAACSPGIMRDKALEHAVYILLGSSIDKKKAAEGKQQP